MFFSYSDSLLFLFPFANIRQKRPLPNFFHQYFFAATLHFLLISRSPFHIQNTPPHTATLASEKCHASHRFTPHVASRHATRRVNENYTSHFGASHIAFPEIAQTPLQMRISPHRKPLLTTSNSEPFFQHLRTPLFYVPLPLFCTRNCTISHKKHRKSAKNSIFLAIFLLIFFSSTLFLYLCPE